ALMHSLPIAYPVTHQVEVVRPGDNRRFEAINVRGNRIPRAHRTVIGGVEVTTLERTIIDVARSYNLDIAVAMLDDALHRGLTRPVHGEASHGEGAVGDRPRRGEPRTPRRGDCRGQTRPTRPRGDGPADHGPRRIARHGCQGRLPPQASTADRRHRWPRQDLP